MKRLLLITSSLFALFAANAQATFQVGSGVKITTSGTPNIVYTGGSVVNNGSLAMSSGTLKTTGATTFSGTGTASLNDVSFFTGSELQQQLSVTGTATVNGTLSAGNELLYIRGDQSAAAKLVNNGVLTGSVKGLNTNATVTSGAPGFSSSLSTNIAGTNTRYQWQESADGNSWTDIFGQTAAAYQAVVNSTRSYRALISASNSAFTGVTSPVKLSAVAESDYFITEWTFLATPSTLTIGYLFTGDSVSYSFTTNKGKSGSGRVHRPTGGSQILQLGSAMEVGEVLTLKISPDSLKAITFSGTHRTYLTNVKQWGSVKWTSMTSMFSGCNNLQITAADIPDLTLINSLQSTFQDCWKLDGPANIGSWNTSTITNLFRTFFNARIFNQNINNWDVSKVSNMQSLFNNAYKYNQPLDKWDVRKVTNFSYLFCGAELFNQDIGQWKTELGTNMEGMFYSAFAFNKDISTWPVDSVVNLIGFLRNTKSFDQDISPLAAKLKSVVILDNFMMDTCKLSTANYDAWLIGLAATGFTGKTITSRFQTYCGAKAERDTLTLKRSWLVSDAGMSAGPCVNAAPDISGLPASPTTCDDRTYTTAFTVSDERLNSVVLSAFSSNTTLLPNANLALTNTGTATPSITVTPVSGQAGLAAIGIVATDHLGQKDTAYLYLGIGNPVQTLSVYAGSTSGTANGTLAEAKFSRPYGMARDSKGNIFVTDEVSHCIRKITPEGVVSTFAGSAGVSGYVEGIGTAARFFYPREVIVDKNDNLYITDTENHRVRKITPDGTTSLVAGTGTPSSTNGNALGQASFSSPMGIVIDAQGDLFIGDYNGRRIRKINMTTAQVSTVAGSGANGSQDGTALQASFSSPAGLVFDQSGNLLIADYFNSKVRKLDQSNVVTTIIGNGQNTSTEGSGTQAAIGWVDFLSVDPGNGDVYMGLDACKIRKFNTAGQITTVIDNGCALVLGPLATASTGGAKKFLFLPGGDILLTSGTRILKIGTTYEPCNAKPAFSPASLANDTLCLVSSNTNLTSRTLTVSDADGTIASTVVSSSNPSLVSAINTGSATNVVIALNQKANESGSAVIKVVSTDNLGAKDSVSFTIVVNKVVALSFNINVTCNGAQNGSAGVSVSGGTAPYTYSWTVFTDSTRSLITKIPSGTYTVTVKDKFNCQASKSITVTQPAALVVVKDSSLISCYGLEDGRAKVSPSGGSTPYEYAWSNGKTSKEITGLAAGTYSVTVTDVNSCQRLISFNITQPADITNPTIADGGEVCAGQTVTFTSGSNATSFQWEKSSSSLSADFTPLSDGTFFTGSGTKSLTITSSELTADARYRVKQIQSATCFKYSPGIGFSAKDCNALPQFASTALYNDTLCYDTLNHTLGSRAINVSDSDGSIVSTEVKSSNPNLVSVSNSGTNTAVNLVLTQKANQYGSAVITVISTDDLGAKDSVSFRIRVNKLLGSVFSTGLKCFGDSTILTASGSDGVAPYSYVWTGVTSSVDTTPKVGPGSYSVLITDKFGCKATVKPTVTSPPQIVFVKDSSNISCFGANDGKASVTVSGGAGDKELLWSPSGATTNQILNQAPGIKTVTATDGFGCTASTTFNITEPAQIINPPISNQSDICQGSTVNFTTTASNVNSYQWEKSPDGNTNANYTALADTGAYSGTATNKISIVSGPGSANALYRVKLIQSANCFTYSTPVMFTNKVCNVAPVLSGIQNQLICQNDTLTDLPFTVTDENPSGITYTVTSSNSVVVPASVIQITGSGSDRKVHFNAALTTPGTAIIKITATDNGVGNLQGSTQFTLKVNNLPTISLADFPSVCTNDDPFKLDQGIPVNGTYSGTGVNQGTFYPETAGDFAITFSYTRPSTGCTASATKTINVKAAPELTFTLDPVCANAAPVALSATPEGGIFSGNGVSNGKLYVANVSGIKPRVTYSYTAANGCSSAVTNPIEIKDTVAVALADFDGLCSGANAITLNQGTPAGGTYSGTGVTNGTFNPATSGAGTFAITYVVEDDGCSSTAVKNITVTASPEITVPQNLSVCINAEPITLSGASPVGGSFSGNGITDYTFNPLTAGVGTHTITYSYTSGGCTANGSFSITVTALPSGSLQANDGVSACQGESLGLTIAQADANAVYSWKKDGQEINGAHGISYEATVSGTYSADITYGGCTTTTNSVTLTFNELPVPVISVSQNSFCLGGTVTLSTDQYSTYVWKKGNDVVGEDPTYTVQDAGTYTLSVKDINGCSGTSQSLTLSQNSGVVISANGPASICPGESVVLSAAQAVSYQWYNAGGMIAGATAKDYSVNTPGTYYVTATDNSGCTSTSSTITVTAKSGEALPEIRSNSSTEFCQGESVVLVTGNYSKYQWYRNGNKIQGANFSELNEAKGGSISVQVTGNNGCVIRSEATVVTVNQPANVNLDQAFNNELCSPNTLVLTAANAQGAVYQWYRTNEKIAGATSNSYEVSETGLYQLFAETEKGCSSKSGLILVKVKATPEVPTITITDVNQLSSSSAVNNQWYKDGQKIEGATSQLLNITENGIYRVEVTNGNGCSSSSDDYNLNNIAVDEVSGTNWSVYPNPFTNRVTVKISGSAVYQLYDMTGKLVMEGTLSKGENDINTAALAKGVYHLRSVDKVTPLTIRLIKN